MALTPMPSLRRSIKADVSKNKSLKDILPSTTDALEVLSVEELDYHTYNTKTTVKVLENGVEKDRVLLYDRMNLNTLLANVTTVGNTIGEMIEDLNSKGYDFTVDDLELVNNKIKAKATSLGYYNGDLPPTDCSDKLYFTLRGSNTAQGSIDYDCIEAYAGKVVCNGIAYSPAAGNMGEPGKLSYLGNTIRDAFGGPSISRGFEFSVPGDPTSEMVDMPYLQNFTNDHQIIKMYYYYYEGDVFRDGEGDLNELVIDVLTRVLTTNQLNTTLQITTKQATTPQEIEEWDTVDSASWRAVLGGVASNNKMITEVAFTLCPNPICMPTEMSVPNILKNSRPINNGFWKMKLQLVKPLTNEVITETLTITSSTPGTNETTFVPVGVAAEWLENKGFSVTHGGEGKHQFSSYSRIFRGADGSANGPGDIPAILRFLPADDVDPSNDVWRSALDFIRSEQGLLVNPSRDQGFEIKSCGSEEFEGL